MFFINLSEVKYAVDETIKLLEELIESEGQDGNIEGTESLDIELKQFEKAKKELKELSSIHVDSCLLFKTLKEYCSSLDEEKLKQNLDIAIRRKQFNIVIIENSIRKLEKILNCDKGDK